MAESQTRGVRGYRIRHAAAGDMARVCDIARRAWVRVHDSFRRIMGEEMHGVLCAGWEEDKEAQVRNHWARHPEWFRVVVREDTDEVVAFISFRIDRRHLMGVIGNNAVAPEAQGQGIATMMYACVLDLFRREGLRFASVGTGLDEGHAPARRAYEKAGFDIACPKVTYYKYL